MRTNKDLEMAKYTPVDRWNKTIHEIGLSEPVEVTIANLPHQQIADNVLNLYTRILALEEKYNLPDEVPVNPTPTPTPTPLPTKTIDIVGYKDGDYNASHFQGENLKVNLTNAQNGHEIYVQRSAEALNSNTTSGWGNDGSGIVKWGVADITGIHAKLHTTAHYQELAENMYTMTYVATDNATKGTPQEAKFLRKVRGKSWSKKPRFPYQANAAFYGFGETVKLTDDTVDIFFIASDLTKAEAEGKELTVSLYSLYNRAGTSGGGLGTGTTTVPEDRTSSVDAVRAVVTNGIAHFANVPIPKKANPAEGQKITTIYYEIGTPDIPYTGDGTGFTEFDSTATTAICRGQRNYSERYITEQIEGLSF